MALAFPFFSFCPGFFAFLTIMNNDRRSKINSESENERERERDLIVFSERMRVCRPLFHFWN
jgi:hypothetical protein